MGVTVQHPDKLLSKFTIHNIQSFKQKAIQWAAQFDTCCYLDNNNYDQYKHHDFECLMAVDAIDKLTILNNDPFKSLKQFHEQKKDWLFGFLTYDLKNKIELKPNSHLSLLSSNNFDGIQMPEIHFFQPKYIITIKKNNPVVIIQADDDPEKIYNDIISHNSTKSNTYLTKPIIKQRISKQKYLETIQTIKKHIVEGDVYEMNFCQEFFAENVQLDPLDIFIQLNEIAAAPFSAYYQTQNKYLLCSSPERFLKKSGKQLLSQPIKGTIRKGNDAEEDKLLKKQLSNSLKDQAENIMIVDLVRNDLARSSVPGSVKVKELFGIYSFRQVHQMLSSITSELKKDTHFTNAIKNAFPMGSMTGAPKIAAMQLIEEYEQTKRGLFSGSVGYITPEGDFDFNVIIRSMLYNAENKYLSFQTGGAITYDSIPEQEYEECLLKAKGMMEVMNKK